ncbi:hypothetical protein D3OALGA1CA_84 [Olavius algarvensis associated proteobacterium Delta 3]|nr:hypothetical protein D3OALGA1CA_84 [Olavius algarvensis associated proteobacterium Delta 3]
MSTSERPIENLLTTHMDEEEVRLFMDQFEYQRFDNGEFVFREGDPGDVLYIVKTGLVSLVKEITVDVNKKLVLARPGMIFGEFSFMDRGERSASAVTEDDSELFSLKRAVFDQFILKQPQAGIKVYMNLLQIVVERLRRTNDAYRDAVRWGLEITGTQKLNFQYLITENVEIRIELSNGKTVEGKVLQLERSDAGHEMILANKLGKLTIIPYHAIVSVGLAD